MDGSDHGSRALHVSSDKEISAGSLGAEASRTRKRALAREGKVVVWIDGGLHATEVVTARQYDQDGLSSS